MKSKPAVGLLTLLAVGLITWSVTSTIAAGLLGGREAFVEWRADNMALYYGIWFAEVIVIGLPVLWFVGRRMGEYAAQQDQAAVEARGVGRLAGAALRGDKKAVGRLVKLLDDGSPAVKYQCARALALLDDKAIDEDLFRKVRYWDGNLKLGLIDTLKRTMDVRAIKLVRMLSEDRNPMVARKARTALVILTSRSKNMDDMVAKRRKEAQARTAKAGRKKPRPAAPPKDAPPAGPKTAAAPGEPATAEVTPAAAGPRTSVEAPAAPDAPASATEPSAPASAREPSAPPSAREPEATPD